MLHAPRQTGKTSALLAMMATLNAQGRFACAYANIEGAQAARGDETQGIPAACDALVDAIELYLANRELKTWYKAEKASIAPQHLLTSVLQQWAQTASTPVVLLLDEVDALRRHFASGASAGVPPGVSSWCGRRCRIPSYWCKPALG